MASYTEIFNLRTDPGLRNRVQVAIAVKSQAILEEATPSADRLTFAKEALKSPSSKIEEALWYMFAVDKDLTSAQIQGATDANIQTRTDAYVDAVAP